jgi:hypothetical protein
MLHNFDDIRPFYDTEVTQALKEMTSEPELPVILKSIFPAKDPEELYSRLKSYHTVKDFQSQFVIEVVRVIIERSVDGLTWSGLEKLNRDKVCLFMSNHRDIVLDPTLMDLILFENGFSIPQLAIGNNLLVSPLVTKIVKLNKSFIVQRNESARQMYEAWKKLSAYIYHVITERKENIWIAQREGRAKDGDDRTQSGILKMFLMNFGEENIDVIRRLNIVPVSITYEYDPCDYLKALELYHVAKEMPFVKDDYFNAKSMLYGIQGKKGRVHFSFGRPINDLLQDHPEPDNPNDWVKWLANEIDTEIHRNYHLWPTNYIACDMLQDQNTYADQYTEEQKKNFISRMEERLNNSPENMRDELRKLMLTNYANSVINQQKVFESGQ